jgi:glycerol-3-phosphate dehydrogenase subunit C
MLKFEWPLILPDDEDVKRLSEATWDLSEYIVDIARNEGLAPGMSPIDGGVTVHIACHARAQNMGQKAADLLKLVPEADVNVIERCSGHGGAWGYKKDNYEVALKVGKPVARQVANATSAFVTSECPLAGLHIIQGVEQLGKDAPPELLGHPVEFLARAYGLIK